MTWMGGGTPDGTRAGAVEGTDATGTIGTGSCAASVGMLPRVVGVGAGTGVTTVPCGLVKVDP